MPTLLASCTLTRIVQTDAPTWNAAGSGHRYSHDTVVRSSVWKGKNTVKIACGCENGMGRFRVQTKPGDVVLGFLTAGFLVRQRIGWDCAQRDDGPSDM